MKRFIFKLSAALLLAYWIVLVYTVLHEGGHALAAVLFGGSINQFDVNFLTSSPRVSYTGSFTQLQRGVISAAGPLLPVVMWSAWLLLTTGKSRPIYRYIQGISSVGIISSLIPAVAIPLLYQMGKPVPNDDWTRFMQHSSLNGYLVSGFILLVMVFAIRLAVARIGNIRQTIGELRSTNVSKVPDKVVISILLVTLLTLVPLMASSSVSPTRDISRVTAGLVNGGLPLASFTVAGSSEYVTMRLDYSFSASEADFVIVVVSSDGVQVWDEEWIGKGISAQSQEDLALLPGDYEVVMQGTARDLKIEVNWRQLK